jgi:hypothetical protein
MAKHPIDLEYEIVVAKVGGVKHRIVFEQIATEIERYDV